MNCVLSTVAFDRRLKDTIDISGDHKTQDSIKSAGIDCRSFVFNRKIFLNCSVTRIIQSIGIDRLWIRAKEKMKAIGSVALRGGAQMAPAQTAGRKSARVVPVKCMSSNGKTTEGGAELVRVDFIWVAR